MLGRHQHARAHRAVLGGDHPALLMGGAVDHLAGDDPGLGRDLHAAGSGRDAQHLAGDLAILGGDQHIANHLAGGRDPAVGGVGRPLVDQHAAPPFIVRLAHQHPLGDRLVLRRHGLDAPGGRPNHDRLGDGPPGGRDGEGLDPFGPDQLPPRLVAVDRRNHPALGAGGAVEHLFGDILVAAGRQHPFVAPARLGIGRQVLSAAGEGRADAQRRDGDDRRRGRAEKRSVPAHAMAPPQTPVNHDPLNLVSARACPVFG